MGSQVERKEEVVKALQLRENARNRRARKIRLGDMLKRVRRRWIRGGVE